MPHPPARSKQIKLVKGQTKALRLQVFDRDGAPVNLNGADVRFSVAKSGVAPLIALSVGSGVTIEDAQEGVCSVVLSASDTSLLDVGEYEYDAWVVFVKSSGEERYPVARGKLKVELPVTQF